ncbi:DUF1634 domain-containing protein [Paenibacillus melissococcoides]|uniref:DUF1634 domain-containing protein n=1 Tax=Paenibacillus melissococcoides TaxID=2912268 RepID=A0ABM9G0B7_9BACL|nr:DUF1634 domain-containing protein [Paenibacillus melissococcoides]CAH8245038.1 DUF1634 domain-containing protein [Paenibacillus melissococcoides]CAH8709719.1 DUF1634 domain-containing protein [Paenibacillus melissococcoides]CAH8710445.1 DUF1634 domain-containing protein [Paenibacillus melissococcoides]
MNEPKNKEKQMLDVEAAVSSFLRIGVLTSAAVIVTGLIMFLVTGVSGYPEGEYPTTVTAIIQGIAAGRAYAIMMGGLLLLIMTPVVRVFISIFVFAKEKDDIYVAITSLVFVILMISLALGRAG